MLFNIEFRHARNRRRQSDGAVQSCPRGMSHNNPKTRSTVGTLLLTRLLLATKTHNYSQTGKVFMSILDSPAYAIDGPTCRPNLTQIRSINAHLLYITVILPALAAFISFLLNEYILLH